MTDLDKYFEISWVNQQEIAHLMECDRATINRRQKEGLPYKADGPGGSNQYYFPLVLYWDVGYTAMTTRGPIAKAGLRDVAMVYAVGRLVAGSTTNDISRAVNTIVKGLGLTDSEAIAAIDRARGWWVATEGRIPG